MSRSRTLCSVLVLAIPILFGAVPSLAQAPEGSPFIQSVTPGSGPTAGGTSVTISGGNFESPASASFGGSAATEVTVVNGTTITAKTPAHAAGAVTVTVTVPSGTAPPLTSGFIYTDGPAVTSVYPASGPEAGGTFVTITGAGFTPDAAVHFGSTAATNVQVLSDTAIQCTTPPQAALAAPTVTGVSPSSGPTEGGTVVNITGTDFTDATAVRFGGTDVLTFNVLTPSSIECKNPALAAGQVHVTVTTSAGTSPETSADLFTYTGAAQPPTVSGVNPSSGLTAGGIPVEITGSGFTGATAVKFGETAATSFDVLSGTTIKATAPAHAAGTVHVTVTTPDGTSATSTADQFTYSDSPQPPTVTGVSPNSGLLMGFTQVTIAGTNFTGATAVTFGETAAASFTVNSSTSISATSPSHAAGQVHVTVTTPNGTSAATSADLFTYSDSPPPGIASVSPNSGPTSGGTAVTITGLNFTGATAVTFGGTAATSFTVISAGQISATSPAHAAGAVHVRVTTPNGTSQESDYDLFTYTGGGSCTLTCTATVPATGATGATLNFAATATATGCSGTVSYSWTFGDGQTSTQQNPTHAYATAGTYSWSMTAMVGETLCQKYGTVQVLSPPLIATVSKMSSPFRLKVVGGNFHPDCTIKINGAPVPSTAWKNASKIIAMKGKTLKAMCPNGQMVQITVTNNDDGAVSAPYPFTP